MSQDRRQGICPLAEYDGREPFAETFMAEEDEHPYIRYARAHCASWRESPVRIGSAERIVGIPRPPRVVHSNIAGGLGFNRGLCEKLMETDPGPRDAMQALLDYFPGRHVTRDLIHDEAIRRGAPWHGTVGNGASFQGHMVVDYAKVLRIGLTGLRREIEETMSVSDAGSKSAFYEAMLLYCDNMRDLCRRYAAAAAALQAQAPSAARRDEVSDIAAVCRHVSTQPARTFREAVQLYWFTCLLDEVDDPGRFDQYLFPFYRDDLAAGRMTREQARDLLEELWCKLDQSNAWSLVLGGQTPDGTDASNELTYLCLEVTRDLRMTHPAVALRVFSGTPRRLWRLAVQCIARGGGMPSLANDDAVVPALINSGVPLPDARDYGMGGCIEFQICGKSNHGGEDGQINLAKCLELALNDGRCAQTGERLGVETGDPATFTAFDQVFDAYKRQVESAIAAIITQCNVGQEIKSRQGAKMFRSLLVDDCIARGLDCEGGGARYGNGQILTMGIVVVADSLAAIKALVFEDEAVTMAELLQALRDNWQGHEALRQRILHQAPRYGNGDERVDGLAHEVSEHVWSLLRSYRTHRGGRYTGLAVYFSRQLGYGLRTGPTPDGRFDGDVLEDSIGPWPGRDTCGPTAMFHSAARIAQNLAGGGAVLNLKLTKSCLTSDEDVEKTIDLVRTYFALGGQYVQVTVASAAELRAAMREPEKWRHLIVRVGGYSAYFTTLDPKLQHSIIERTAYEAS